ncbi:hypothetical protein ACH5RR_012969 [Cinchona calisaya]|uniref:Uncharacterized protein n=1 Tax=Cinchona calisaya TaxID=153742 RepID=A0ABD3A2D5_9GENT
MATELSLSLSLSASGPVLPSIGGSPDRNLASRNRRQAPLEFALLPIPEGVARPTRMICFKELFHPVERANKNVIKRQGETPRLDLFRSDDNDDGCNLTQAPPLSVAAENKGTGTGTGTGTIPAQERYLTFNTQSKERRVQFESHDQEIKKRKVATNNKEIRIFKKIKPHNHVPGG